MIRTSILFLVLLFGLVSKVSAQAPWLETGDAPDGPNVSQPTVGIGPISQIVGQLDRANGDHVDTYAITITNPMTFYASTSEHLGGDLLSALPIEGLQNSRMWLWRSSILREGLPTIALANDDDAFFPGDLASTISDESSFTMLTTGNVDSTAMGVNLIAGETYLLSISTFDNDPEDASNVDLIEFGPDLTALYGPNVAAGPFDHWENSPSSEEGGYIIALQGAEFSVVPEPTSLLGCVFLAIPFLRHRFS